MKPIHSSEHADSKRDLFHDLDQTEWRGAKKHVFCVDYSMGVRYEELKSRQDEVRHPFGGHALAGE